MLPVSRRQARGVMDVFDRMQRDLERMFDRDSGEGMRSIAEYPVDIHEDEKNLYVDAEVPGFTKEEIELSVDQGLLSIIAEHREEEQPKGREHLKERRYRRIERRFTLPTSVDEQNVEAKLEAGVLHLTLHKAEPQRRRIEIK